MTFKRSNCFLIFLLFSVWMIVWEKVAFAYLDPLTGSFILQFIFGGIAALVTSVKLNWDKIKPYITKKNTAKTNLRQKKEINPDKKQSFISNWSHMDDFLSLPPSHREIVFYSEGSNDWVHFYPVIKHLTQTDQHIICYLSSSPDDPGLHLNSPNVFQFLIGKGVIRTFLFRNIQAGVFVMTMPDLGTYYLKRSIHPVHYVYIFHNMVSSHMTFKSGAFDHFDTIFCVGPYHIEEIRKTEILNELPKKQLFNHGYGRLDSILKKVKNNQHSSSNNGKPKILIAPSWGNQGLLEIKGKELIEILLNAGYYVVIRPHPETMKHSRKLINSIQKRFSKHPNYFFEDTITSLESLFQSDLMISDWSGVALEYAFGLEKPVLFIDVPRKVNNPNYTKINIVPIEDSIRHEIGYVLPPEQIQDITKYIKTLFKNTSNFKSNICNLRNKLVYNLGNSGLRGAEKLVDIANNNTNNMV